MNAQQARHNANLLYGFSFSWMFIPIIPVMVPYITGHGLSMQEFLELQAIFGLGVALLEVPSGYLADLWGRRNTILIGSAFSGIGFTYFVFCSGYWDFLVFELALAVSLSMKSGADFSLLYDSLAITHKEDRSVLQSAISRKHFLTLSAEAVSAVLGGFLAASSLALVAQFNAVVSWVPLLLILFIREAPIEKMSADEHWQNLKRITRHLFASDRLLRMIFINFVAWSLSTFCAVWLLQKHWQDQDIGVAQFGYIWAALQLVAAFSGQYSIALEKKIGTKAVLVLTSSLPIIGYLGLGFSGALGAIGFAFSFYVSRGLTQVIFLEALNWRVPSQFRATVNSLTGLFMRLIFFVVGPVLGILIDRFGTKFAALTLAGVYLVLFVVLLLPMVHFLRKPKRSQES
ncbi:MAG: MFS transporter [Pseudomonadota bacterium]